MEIRVDHDSADRRDGDCESGAGEGAAEGSGGGEVLRGAVTPESNCRLLC